MIQLITPEDYEEFDIKCRLDIRQIQDEEGEKLIMSIFGYGIVILL